MALTKLYGEATNVNGYIQFSVKNTSKTDASCYGKIDLYSKQGLLAATEYVDMSNFGASEERDYQVKFKANDIASYEVTLVEDMPDKSNIINLFGWEIDLTDVFGMDLSNATIFGVKLTELFNWENIKTAGGNAWSGIRIFLAAIPWWGYAIATGIILWYMPKGYLFGIFPF